MSSQTQMGRLHVATAAKRTGKVATRKVKDSFCKGSDGVYPGTSPRMKLRPALPACEPSGKTTSDSTGTASSLIPMHTPPQVKTFLNSRPKLIEGSSKKMAPSLPAVTGPQRFLPYRGPRSFSGLQSKSIMAFSPCSFRHCPPSLNPSFIMTLLIIGSGISPDCFAARQRRVQL